MMIKCKLCGSNKTKLTHKRDGFIYCKCFKCDCLFLYPQPKTAELTKFYKNIFSYKAGSTNEKQIRNQSRKIINDLIKFNPQGKSLLDIGSGFGYFLDEANTLNITTTGIEPSKQLAEFSIQNYNVDVKQTTFENYFQTHKKEKYDFITLIHVIEHIQNPIIFIKKITSLLNDNGILYIETPNLKSHLYNNERENYTFLTPPDHLFIFNVQLINQLYTSIKNIVLIKSSTYSYPEHFAGIIKIIVKRLFDREIKSFTSNIKLVHPKGIQNLRTKSLKYLLFDLLFSRIFYKLLNFGGYGSILQLYIKKNS